MSLRIINICNNDWANFSYDNAQALRKVGVDCQAFKFAGHKNNYLAEAKFVSHKELQRQISKADIVQVHHSDKGMVDYVKDHPKVVVYHAGTAYRKYYKFYNDLFNPFVKASILALGEFWELGAKNPKYLVGAVDTTKIKAHFGQSFSTPRIAHYPSNVLKKGTDHIKQMLKEVSKKGRRFKFLGEDVYLVSFAENLKRMADCDIYIELFQLKLHGQLYGSFGISALEAAALGKIVITNNLSWKVYQTHYGPCALVIVNTETDFIDKIFNLIDSPDALLRAKQEETRDWVVQNHSYEATGKRLRDILKL